MPKKKFACNHCGDTLEWYEKWLHETWMKKFDGKYYCVWCLHKLAKFFVDDAGAS